jgi:hypothetical protein
VAQDIDATDRFHELLNTQGTRQLLTALPPDRGRHQWPPRGTHANLPPRNPPALGTPAVSVSTDLTPFDASSIAAEYLGLVTGDNARRDAIVAWTHGDASTERGDKRMGSIYHSSPVIIGPPGADRSDETFNEFRQLIGDRPRVVYVGTNDGILHAFLADDYDHDSGGATTTYTAGHEIWGFIPPILLDELEDTMTSHQWMLDGTPVIQDVITARTGTGSAADWRTVLVMGFRQGARGYFALDITDPFEPKFLWQYTHPQLGQTYGQPRMAQVNVEFATGGIHQRTVAILPGGWGGAELAGVNSPSDSRHIPETVSGITPRGSRRNWGTQGRALFVVDILTGKLIRHFDDFPSPLTGGVSVFPGSVGSDAQAAYFNDHDGILWRLDLSSKDPDDWDYQAIWDMFHGLPADARAACLQPAPALHSRGRPRGHHPGERQRGHARGRNGHEPRGVAHGDHQREHHHVRVHGRGHDRQLGHLEWSRQLPERAAPRRAGHGTARALQRRGLLRHVRDRRSGQQRVLFRLQPPLGRRLHRARGQQPQRAGGAPSAPRDRRTETVAFDHTIPGFQSLENGLLMGVGIAARPRCNSSDEPPGETDPYVGNPQARHHVTDAAPAQFELVAQISGQGSGAGGGAVATIGLSVTTPPIQVQTVGAVRRVE